MCIRTGKGVELAWHCTAPLYCPPRFGWWVIVSAAAAAEDFVIRGVAVSDLPSSSLFPTSHFPLPQPFRRSKVGLEVLVCRLG